MIIIQYSIPRSGSTLLYNVLRCLYREPVVKTHYSTEDIGLAPRATPIRKKGKRQKMTDKIKFHRVICPTCKTEMDLKQGKFGWFYGCPNWPDCDIAHCCHQPGTSTPGKPLGRPADKATREKRHEAHRVFDLLWKEKHMRRRDAYAWLREQLGISKWKCHIGRMNLARCEQVIQICRNKLAELG